MTKPALPTTNPFFEGPAADAGDDEHADTAELEGGAADESAEAEGGDEGEADERPASAFFDAKGESDEEAEEDPEGEGKPREKPHPKQISARVNKLRGQRDEARQAHAALEAEIAPLREVSELVERHYGRFGDQRAEALAMDAAFMDAFEELSANPTVKAAYAVLKRHVDQKTGTNTERRPAAGKETMKVTTKDTATDPNIEIFRAQAEERLEAATEGLKPIYAKAVREHILGSCKTGADFAKLSDRRIAALGREWFEENDVDAEEAMLAAPAKKAARPPAARAARGSSSAGGAGSEERSNGAERKPIKTHDEMQAHLQRKREQFGRRLQA